MRRVAAGLLLAAIIAAGPAWAEGPDAHRVGDRRSGYAYLSEQTRALQDDDFANPGFLWVERGEALWDEVEGDGGRSCASCHGDAAAGMRGARARYPAFDPGTGGLVNLEGRINRCRVEHMGVAPWPYESDEMLGMAAFVGLQSRGMPVDVEVDGPAAPFFEAGRAFWFRRRGQLDLACSQCHDDNAGRRLRGDVVSQGQSNGFPIYRQTWQAMGSLHRMFRWCNTSVRAEPYPLGADEYVSLELYLAWRGRGLPVEAPAVRR